MSRIGAAGTFTDCHTRASCSTSKQQNDSDSLVSNGYWQTAVEDASRRDHARRSRKASTEHEQNRKPCTFEQQHQNIYSTQAAVALGDDSIYAPAKKAPN
jgi:hypothetical protein